MSLKDFIRANMPKFLLQWNRKRKKNAVRSALQEQERKGEGVTLNELFEQFKQAGITSGDSVLVHSSLSKIGFIAGGPEAFIRALVQVVGPNGNILMPTSPNGAFQLDYIRKLTVFDVNQAPSALGKITETFRTWPGTIRSASPTEPVSALGPDAAWFTSGHLGCETPYTAESPFARLAEKNGKILYVGVTLDNAGTSLHVLEDAVPDFKFPVYFPELFNCRIRLSTGEEQQVKIKVHNPEQSAKRKCDKLLPLFKSSGCYHEAQIGQAKTLVFDAKKMKETMLREYRENGVTMYTPFGS